MNTTITLTIFTPTYNRAHTLPRVYQSLCKQTCKDFIWLIVDDGSADNTADLVKSWQAADNGFEIRYIYKENGGMHTAHNTAYENITTELNVCIDSDDSMPEYAVEHILKKWDEVRNEGYAGLTGLDAVMGTGEIIGTSFPPDMREVKLTQYYEHGGSGDKKIVYRTDLMKSLPPYPVFPGEKYVALAYKYLMVEQKYSLAVLNEVLCDVEYQPDGSSNNMWKQYLRNPRGFAFWRVVRMTYPITVRRMLMDCVHYCSHSILSKNRKYIAESPRKALTVMCTIPGFFLSILTRIKANSN